MIRHSRMLHRAIVLAAAGVLAGCDAPTTSGPAKARAGAPSMLVTPACAGTGGQTHAGGSITTVQTWSRAGSPHRVMGWIYVDAGGRLTVEPGAVLCFEPGTALRARNGGRILARGRETAVILFTARDPARGWSGLQFYGSPAVHSYLTNVRIEHVAWNSTAVVAADYHPVAIDSAVIRQSGQAAYLYSPMTRLSRSRVDTTTNRGYPAVDLAHGSTFEKTTVRGAAGVGVRVSGPNVSLVGGRIDGSSGVGLQMRYSYLLATTTPAVRVVNGRSNPVDLPVDALVRLYPTPGLQDSLRGNARDTLIVSGGTLRRTLALGTRPVRVTQTVQVDSAGVFGAQAGTRVVFERYAGLRVTNGGRVMARGSAASRVLFTADDPAVGWEGVYFASNGSSLSYLTNVRIEHVEFYEYAVAVYDYHRVILDSAVIRHSGGGVLLRSQNSRISRTRVDSTLNADLAGVGLSSNALIESTRIRAPAGPGLRIYASTVQVVSCEVREGDGDGILMQYPVPVHACNLVNNVGPGIRNLSGTSADVKNNWWGSTGGPAGAGGDGAVGPLVFSPWRTTPYVLPYVP